jgi:hypothetical protein
VSFGGSAAFRSPEPVSWSGRSATSTWSKPFAALLRMAFETVSVKTSVPDTNATPSSTASMVISSRALCARTLRRAVRNMVGISVQSVDEGTGRRTGRRCARRGVRGGAGCAAVRGARRAADAALGVEGLHAVQHRLRARGPQLVDDPPVGEEHDAVGVGGGDRVVGDHHDGLLVRAHRVAQEAQDLRPRPGVEVAGGLVGEDDLRARDQRPGDRDPLLLPAGELRRPVPEPR